jgi:hypothetical protein
MAFPFRETDLTAKMGAREQIRDGIGVWASIERIGNEGKNTTRSEIFLGVARYNWCGQLSYLESGRGKEDSSVLDGD